MWRRFWGCARFTLAWRRCWSAFKYLHYGLGALLAFAALKMLAAKWIDVPVTLSLVVIGVILAVCAVASLSAGMKTVNSGGVKK